MSNELISIEQSSALVLFTENDKVESLINQVKQIAAEKQNELGKLDLSVGTNRKKIISLSSDVTRTKTYIETFGKDLAAKLKEMPKKVDAARKQIRDELDKLSEDIRQPVTAWENAEKERIAAEQLKKQIESDHAEAIQMNEVFDLRKAEAERKRIEHENELKRQAAEKARIEAENKAREEIEAAARREAELKLAAERAEREKQLAIERAEREKQEAIEAERRKAEQAERMRLAEIERLKQEELKRQADIEHQRNIHNEILNDFIKNHVSEKYAKLCIKLIAKGLISHTKIIY
ncbi:hypothetical protein QE177_04350 [Arsenophonus sp. aPb]|uniref:hypothetical protein n=1 Tax=Arsenophonus sp. aPb TaxID=3041619 RepID=UPI00246963E0|nr:hypothetical protein [Arsenophonus sp. aPb]WGL99118.1 hypothetical protein QE177_04350 [Arsenophonus sp. aPb]